jgi:hypothetical protein
MKSTNEILDEMMGRRGPNQDAISSRVSGGVLTGKSSTPKSVAATRDCSSLLNPGPADPSLYRT